MALHISLVVVCMYLLLKTSSINIISVRQDCFLLMLNLFYYKTFCNNCYNSIFKKILPNKTTSVFSQMDTVMILKWQKHIKNKVLPHWRSAICLVFLQNISRISSGVTTMSQCLHSKDNVSLMLLIFSLGTLIYALMLLFSRDLACLQASSSIVKNTFAYSNKLVEFPDLWAIQKLPKCNGCRKVTGLTPKNPNRSRCATNMVINQNARKFGEGQTWKLE